MTIFSYWFISKNNTYYDQNDKNYCFKVPPTRLILRYDIVLSILNEDFTVFLDKMHNDSLAFNMTLCALRRYTRFVKRISLSVSTFMKVHQNSLNSRMTSIITWTISTLSSWAIIRGGNEEMMKSDWKYFLEVLALDSGNSEIQQLELPAKGKIRVYVSPAHHGRHWLLIPK